MADFLVPFANEDKTIPPRVANDQAFYGSAWSGDPANNFSTIKTDLLQTGQSETLSAEQQRWSNEQDLGIKQTISGIMADETISPNLKKAILQGYALTGAVPSSLKGRYIQKTASADSSSTVEDVKSQDAIVNDLQYRILENKKSEVKDNIINSYENIGFNNPAYGSPFMEGLTSVAANIFMSIPAGFGGLYTLLKEHDPELASQVIAGIQSYAYLPKDKASQQATQDIVNAVQSISLGDEIGNYVNQEMFKPNLTQKKYPFQQLPEYTVPGKPIASTTAALTLDPINWLPLGILKKALSGLKGIVKGVPKIPISSPLEITNVANPQAAGIVAATALADETGKMAASVGTDKGTIIHDWTLPKPMPDAMQKAHPDLTEKIIALDNVAREVYNDLRYDPSIINATDREAEIAKTFQIIKESKSPYYNQSMSLINETDKIFEGKAVFGRNDSYGFRKEEDAKKALINLKESIDTLPPENRGTLSTFREDGQHYIKWDWKKEYDEIKNLTFGKDSIQTSFLGLDVSEISRSAWGRWLFPTGVFPNWVEQSSLRGMERSGKLTETLIKPIRENITSTPFGKELDHLINEAETKGIDYFSPSKIADYFPHLSTNDVSKLFETHVLWRRAQEYNYNFMNREVRHRMEGLKGMYDKAGNYMGAATDKVGDLEKVTIREVWDLENSIPIKYDEIKFNEQGRKLVRLHEKVREGDKVYNYGVIGGKINLDILPKEVLARIPGYSGRKVTEAWYVDATPNKLIVDGYSLTDKETLRNNYKVTKAATRTKVEAEKVAEQLRIDNPNHTISVRPERTDNFGRVMTDYGIHQEMITHSMKRGERLPSLNGLARIEDRMVTLLSTIRSVSRMGAFRAWDDAFQSAFLKGFNKFTRGEFPQYATDIHPLKDMNALEKQEYNTAHRLFKYYERMKNTETLGDFIWTKHLHYIADILEKWKIPSGALRGKHQNPVMFAKTIATSAYIHLAPVRQWLIQPAQQLEMYAISPQTAKKNFANTMAIRMYIGAESDIMKKSGGAEIIKALAKKTGETAGNKEFMDDVKAIYNSGMMQSVDMNSIVHGMFKEVDRNLVENVPEKIWKDIEAATKAPFRFSRAVGFDAAELTNRVGNWLQVKDLWKLKNPEKNWKTKEAQEEIAAEAIKLSGAMNRAGQLPYQEGTLSVFMQFSAINHKMLMNVLQDNATILNGAQRARLAAARFALFGGKYGIPGGAVAYYFIEQSDNPEVKKYAEQIKRGGIDYATNHMIGALVEPEIPPDLAVTKALSPYSEGFLPYFQFAWETTKLFDDRPQNPRFPALSMISSFGQAVEDIQGWFITREVNEMNYKQMFMEAAETASGFNSYSQGLLMMGIDGKITKMGNKYGMEFTRAEALAKMYTGFGTQKEEDLWNIVNLEQDKKSQIKQMAKVIYGQMENQRSKLNDEDYANKVRRLNSFINLLDPVHFNTVDKLSVIEEVEKIDTHNYTTIKQSILVEHWKHHTEQMTKEQRQVNDILRRMPDPEVQKYIKALDEGNL